MTYQSPIRPAPAQVSAVKARSGWASPSSWAVALGVGVIAFGLWAGANRPVTDIAPYHGDIGGYALSPLPRGGDPGRQCLPHPGADQIGPGTGRPAHP